MELTGEEITIRYVFDNRPLINFVLTGRATLLHSICGSRLSTTQSVLAQFKSSAKHLGSLFSSTYSDADECYLAIRSACTTWADHFGVGGIKLVDLPLTQVHIAFELQEKYPLSVDAGESDVLGVCMQHSWVAVLDDFHAREVALNLGISTIGTVELLLKAVKRNLLDLAEAEEALNCMRQASWERAPRYSLEDALHGYVPIWPDMPK
jgi:hypothetical protein